MLKAKGAHALYIEGLSIRTETVASARGRRPWVPDRAVATAPLAQPREARTNENRDVEADKSFDGNPDE
ncbi:MAG TPA: hypothetical protein VGA46_10035 [Methyloceanibacter sp.]